jgi:Na+/proline symporter
LGTEQYGLPPQVGWVLLAAFSMLWIGLGLYWGKKAQSVEGHMLAGRNVGLALGTATAVATWVTSNTTMLAPQFALQFGIWGMLAYSTASIGLFLFAPMAGRIRELMPNGYTSAEFVTLRYGRGAGIIFLCISIFYSLTWMISMAMAGGLLLEALAHIPYVIGMSAILFVCVTYTLFGGLYAVIGTDFIQSCLILFGVVVVGTAVLEVVSVSEIYRALEARRPALLDVLFPAALMALFNNLLFGLGEIAHSNVWWSRAFAMRDGVGRRAYLLGGLLWLPIPVAAGFIALAAPALGISVTRPDMIAPLVASHLLGTAGAVVVFIVIFASLASSIDSLLAATSDLITKEVVQRFFVPRASEASLRRISLLVILGTGLLTWAVCLPKVGTLATVLFFAGPMVGSTIWPIIGGLYRSDINPRAATWAMLLGSASGLIAYFTIGWQTASLIGTAVSMLVTLLGTRLFPHNFSWGELNPDRPAAPTPLTPAAAFARSASASVSTV